MSYPKTTLKGLSAYKATASIQCETRPDETEFISVLATFDNLYFDKSSESGETKNKEVLHTRNVKERESIFTIDIDVKIAA